jgi:hypothetical protein
MRHVAKTASSNKCVSHFAGLHRVFQVCSNQKTAPDHDTHSTTSDSNIIIDSIVLLSTETIMNRERLDGARRPLEQFGGKQELVSRNGGRPFAVLQAERNNPSTASQKINNIDQLFSSQPDLFDSCAWFHYTDKGPDHNPDFREVILTLVLFFRKRGLCYFNNRVHAGGLSCFNTRPRTVERSRDQRLCNVPLDSQPFGDAVDLERGVVDHEKVRANLQWEIDEVQSRLSEVEFCGVRLHVEQALPVECAVGCQEPCNCELGYVSNSERDALRTYHKLGVRKRALWPDPAQAEHFDEIFDFVDSPQHTQLSKYGIEFLACFDEVCEFGCMDRFELPRRRTGSPAACCDHSACKDRTFLGTAQFADKHGHFEDSWTRAKNEEYLPSDPAFLDR